MKRKVPEILAMKLRPWSTKLRERDRGEGKIEGDCAMAGADEGCRVSTGAAAELEDRAVGRTLANERKPAASQGSAAPVVVYRNPANAS
jgi:hypothetical protein